MLDKHPKIDKCPACDRLKQVKCNRITCGHIWTPTKDTVSKCPNCNNRKGYTVVNHEEKGGK